MLARTLFPLMSPLLRELSPACVLADPAVDVDDSLQGESAAGANRLTLEVTGQAIAVDDVRAQAHALFPGWTVASVRAVARCASAGSPSGLKSGAAQLCSPSIATRQSRPPGTAHAAKPPLPVIEYDHTLCHTLEMAAAERVTVTLSAELLEEIDRLERNRSRFVAEAVQHELARRRREALLQSISSPHPETDLIDMGLANWTSDLPDDEGLVDPSGGTAVRWIEGQGWVREPA